MESLEERSLLTAGIAKFDFNLAANDVGPSNGWTKLIATNAAALTPDQFGSGIAIQFTNAPTSANADAYSATPSTIPSDASGIHGGFLVNGSTMSFVLTNLDSQKLYEVWILGGNVSGAAQSQHTTVQGSQSSISFDASILDKNLWVNSSVGTSSKVISGFAPILVSPQVADFNGDQIPDTFVSVAVSPNTTSAELAGVVIQEVPSSFTLPTSGGPFTLTVQNGNRVVKDNAGNVLTFLANSGAITITGQDNFNDTLNVDLTGTNPLTGGLTFNGGANGDDRLTITGGSQGTVNYNYTNAHDGSVVMSNFGTINYTGLEPITNSGTASDVVFNLPPGTNAATLGDDGVSNNGISRLTGATFETTNFTNPTNSLTISRGSASDTLTVNSAPELTSSVTIGSSASPFSAVTFGGNLSLAAGKSLSANATGAITVGIGNGLATTGSGTITLTTASNIALIFGASVTTGSGAILLSANQQSPASSGSFVGIDVDGATISSTSGNITLLGRGGTSGSGQVGVYVQDAGIVGGNTTGTVTVTGTGGTTNDVGFNVGVAIDSSGSMITSGGGKIIVTGAGGTSAAITSGTNDGVNDAGTISAGGAGTLTISGTGAAALAGHGNSGVIISGAAQTSSGALTLTGTGDTGVQITGLVTASADTNVTGTSTFAGGVGFSNAGNINTFSAGNIKVTADSMAISGGIAAESRTVTLLTSTVGQAIDLGGADSGSQLGLTDAELDLVTAGTLNIGDANSGDITVSGASGNITRGTATAMNLTSGGVINFSSGSIDTAGGNLTLTPGNTGKAIFGKTGTDVSVDSANTHGTLSFASGADLAFAINGTTADSTYDVLNVAGNIDLTGTDLVINNPGSFVPSVGNSFAIVKYTGSRGTSMFNTNSVVLNNVTLTVQYDDANKQVLLFAAPAGTLQATLDASNNLAITDIDATGKNNNLTISTSGGNLIISDANEAFISAPAGGSLSNGNKTLTIPLSSVNSLTINGAGGNDTITTSAATAFTGALTINGGTGNDTVNLNSSMTLLAGNALNVDLQDDNASPGVDVINVGPSAVIGLLGSGAATLRASKNIAFASGSSLTTVNGAIAVEANQQATATSGNFVGVDVNGATIQATGGGSVTVKGKGGNDPGGFQYGVEVRSTGLIKGGTGGLQITGLGGGSGASTINAGVLINGGSQASANGSGPVTVQGTGGGGTGGSNYGVWLVDSGTAITSSGGNVQVTGQAGAGGSGNSDGVLVYSSAQINAGGSGTVTVQGTGGNGAADGNIGVSVTNSGTIRSNNGNVQVIGQGGGSGTSGFNVGVLVDGGGQIIAGGSGGTMVQGTGGAAAGDLNSGVDISDTATLISSSGGNVQVTGQGGGSGASKSNDGVSIGFFAQISAGASATVTVQGTGGAGSGTLNTGVQLSGTITSGGGNVQVTGAEGSGPSGYGISTFGGTITTATNGGSITLLGNSMSLGDPISANAASSVSFRPLTSGVGINLGASSNTIGGPLSLSSSELNAVSGGAINVGDANTGPITISAAISRSAGSTTALNLTTATNNSIAFTTSGSLDAKNGNVTLLTNSSGSGAITSGTAAIDISGANLSLTAGSGGIGASGNPLSFVATSVDSTTGGNANQFLTASGSTTIDSTGLSAGTGTIELDGGTFTLGGSDRVNDSTKLNVNGGTFGVATFNDTVGGLTLVSGSVMGTTGILTSATTYQTQSGSISAILAGSVGLTQSTSGATTLSGANTYSGDTTISQGTLKLGAANVIPDGAGKGNVVMNPANGTTATLDIGGFVDTINGLSNSGLGSGIVDNTLIGGPYTLTVGGNNATSTFSGVIKNSAGTLALAKTGTGTLTLSGANTYSDVTTISQGTLKVLGGNAIPGGVSVSAGATLNLGASEAVGVLVNSGTVTASANATLTVFGGGSSGLLTDGTGQLSLTVAGVPSNPMIVTGTGTYTGTTTVSSGVLFVKGSGNITSNVSIANGALLAGTGTTGGVTVASGGSVAPGDYALGPPPPSLGILNSGNLALSSGSNLAVELGGPTVGSEYDQENVAGTVNLGGANLVLGASFTPVVGTTFTIVKNDLSDAIVGTFNGLPQGAVVNSLGNKFQISYQGGDGNDVVLTALDAANPSLQGTSANDIWLVKRNGANDDVTLNGNVIMSTAISSLTSLTINGLAGSDTLTINSSAGDPFPSGGIIFHGGNNSGDKLITTGGTYDSVTSTYTSAGPGHSGSIAFKIGAQTDTVTYDGLAPIDMTGSTATNLVFNLPSTASTAILGDDGIGSNGISQISSGVSATFETTSFSNPSGSLTINRGNAADTMTINPLPDFNASLTIGSAGSEFSTVTFADALNLGADKNLAANATGTISLSTSSSDLAVTGAGKVTLTTARNISLTSGSSITAVNGDVTLSANQQATPTAGPFSGISLISAAITTNGTGKITLLGKGGNDASTNLHYGVLMTSSQVKSTASGASAGTITITGTGGTGNGNQNQGVRMDGTTDVASVDGNVAITGTATQTTSTGQDGVQQINTATMHLTGAAGLTITGTAGSSNGSVGVGLRLAGTDTLGSSQNTFTADRIALDANFLTATATGPVTLKPNTAGIAIDLNTSTNTDTAAGTLELSNQELLRISTPTLTIGSAAAGTISVSGTITRTAATAINLTSNGSINFTTGSLSTNGGNLVLTPGASGSVGVASTLTDATVGSGTISFANGSSLAVPIAGPFSPPNFANGGYDQLRLNGNINLTGAILLLSGSYTPVAGDLFTIVSNIGTVAGSNATTGTFTGVPEGKVVSAVLGGSPANLQITYKGGDGNDVVLTALSATDPVLQGTSGDDNWLVKRNGANVDVTLNGTLIWSPVFATLNSLTINGLVGSAGNDTLTIDLSAGDAVPTAGINFNGGLPTTGPGDKLFITGGSQGDVTYNYTNAHDGSVVMSNFGAVNYTGLEPISNTGTQANITFNLPASANTAFLEDEGATGNGRAQLRSSGTFETTVFANPSGSVTINRGNAADALTVNSLLATDFNAGLTIGSAGSEFSTVTFAGGLTLAANKSLSANATGTISLPNTTSDLAVIGTGTITLTTARNISLSSGSSITSVDGVISLSANQQATPTSGNFEGVSINGALIQSTGIGTVNVFGTGGDDANGSQVGVHLTSSGTSGAIKSGSGGVTVEGFGGGATPGGANHGVMIDGTGQIIVTGTGPITVQGAGGSGSGPGNDGVFLLGSNALIMSGDGAVTVTGLGGGSGNSPSGIGVFVQAGLITTSGAGTINVQGTGGPGTGVTNYGVSVLGGSIGGSDGAVQVTGVEGGGGTGYAIQAQGGSISSTNSLTLIGDSMSFSSTSTLSVSVTGTIAVRPLTPGVGINLGSSTDPIGGPLSLSSAEFADIVTGGTIKIGDSNTGAITLSAALSEPVGSTAAINLTTGTNNHIAFTGSGSLDAKNGNVTLLTNSSGTGAITSGTAAIDLSGANISLTAGSGGIGEGGNPLIVSATNLNATTGGNANQFLSASGSTTIDATGLSAGTGTIELDAGTFSLGGSDRINDSTSLNVNGATFAIGANNETIGGLTLASGNVTGTTGVLTSTTTYQTQSGSISAILAGNVGLTQSTTGTTTLSGANTYSGDTTLSGGTIKLGASNVIPDGTGKGNVVFNPPAGIATLDLGGFSETINGLSNTGGGGSIIDNSVPGGPVTLTFGGNNQGGAFDGLIENTAGTLGITKIGIGTFTLRGANTYSGDTTISGGLFRLGFTEVIPDGPGKGNVVINPSSGTATLDLNGVTETINGLVSSGAGSSRVDNMSGIGSAVINIGAGDTSSAFNGVIGNTLGVLGLFKIGTGTFTLGGANTYTGGTTISQGTLKLGLGASPLPGGAANGADVALNPSSGTATLDLAGRNLVISNLFSTGNGTSVIDNTSVAPSTLSVIDGNYGGTIKNTVGLLHLKTIQSGTLTLTGTGTHVDTSVNGGFPDSTLVVNGTLTGSVSVAATGVLRGTGTVGQLSSGGVLAPGGDVPNFDPGILSSADVQLSGEFDATLRGPTVGTQYSQLNVTGTVTIQPTATLAPGLFGFAPVAGTSFTVINNDSNDPVSGTFNGLPEGTILSVDGGGSVKADFKVSYQGGDGNDVVLTAVNVPPTLDPIANETITEDAAQHTINLTGISSGGTPPQTINITATSDKPGIIPNPTITYTSPNSTGTLKFQPIANQNGLVTITVTVHDDGGTAAGSDTFTRTFTVNVTEVNDPPVANPDLLTAAEDSTANVINVLANDSPGPNESTQTLTVTSALALHGTVTINPDNTLSYTPDPDYNGPDTISYSITDDGTTNGAPDPLTADGTVAVTVTEVNDAPTAVNDTLPSVAEDSGDGLIAFSTLLSNDLKGPANESGQTLDITSITSVVGGTAVIFGTNVQFTPADHFNGTFSFVYSIVDNGTTNGVNDFKTATGTASFTVTEINDPPTGVDDALSNISEDSGPRTITFATLLANDLPGPANESGQTLTITAADSPIGGAVSIVGTDVIFTPAQDFNGTASFVYTLVDDGTTNGQPDPKISTATVTFTIDAVNDAPVFLKGDDQATSDENPATHGPALPIVVPGWATAIAPGPATATDEAGQSLSFTVTTDNDGLFAVKPAIDPATGDLSFRIAPNANGTAHVSVTLKDGGGTAHGGIDETTAPPFAIVVTKPHIWHNTKNSLAVGGTPGLDVDNDGHVAATDVVAIVNYINAFGKFLNGHVPPLGSTLPTGATVGIGQPFGFLDVNADDFVTAADALAIINVINAGQAGGEGEAALEMPTTDDGDLFTLLAVDVASQGKRRGT